MRGCGWTIGVCEQVLRLPAQRPHSRAHLRWKGSDAASASGSDARPMSLEERMTSLAPFSRLTLSSSWGGGVFRQRNHVQSIRVYINAPYGTAWAASGPCREFQKCGKNITIRGRPPTGERHDRGIVTRNTPACCATACVKE